MPYDDDFVTVAPEGPEDYILYDQEWWETARENVSAPSNRSHYLLPELPSRDFSYHELWPEIRANGWVPQADFLVKNQMPGQSGYGVPFRSGNKLRQWLMPQFKIGQNNTTIPEWLHIVEDSQTEQEYEDNETVQERLLKSYPSLGEAMIAARERETSKGYADYRRTGGD